ncbi:hypothetical protein L596_020331 [Steinernema carpocapsae]|uniref:Uncharacterized protein n=1 Tax=Steinernema carpocapsae TaxID=34508 RepID=A0A4U5MTV5_STECR|nr:hypothetical protein L596_020331 [Steinernema carpocapsae]
MTLTRRIHLWFYSHSHKGMARKGEKEHIKEEYTIGRLLRTADHPRPVADRDSGVTVLASEYTFLTSIQIIFMTLQNRLPKSETLLVAMRLLLSTALVFSCLALAAGQQCHIGTSDNGKKYFPVKEDVKKTPNLERSAVLKRCVIALPQILQFLSSLFCNFNNKKSTKISSIFRVKVASKDGFSHKCDVRSEKCEEAECGTFSASTNFGIFVFAPLVFHAALTEEESNILVVLAKRNGEATEKCAKRLLCKPFNRRSRWRSHRTEREALLSLIAKAANDEPRRARPMEGRETLLSTRDCQWK